MKINIETQMVEVQTKDENCWPFLCSIKKDAEGWQKLTLNDLLLSVSEHWYYKNKIPIKAEIILSEPLTSEYLNVVYAAHHGLSEYRPDG